jgi:hypothetical protein
MARPKKKTPYDPATATRQALERMEREAEIARLESQGVVVKLDPGRRIVSAYRSSVFNLLLERKTITPNQHDAAYRLSLDWAAWKGLDGKPDAGAEFVDNGRTPPDKRCLVSDRAIQAGIDVEAVMRMLPTPARRLIKAFMVATVEEDRPSAWRGIVQRETGCLVRDRQTELVVAALELLRQAYEGPNAQHDVVRRHAAAH